MAYYATNTHLAATTLLKACVPWQWARVLAPRRRGVFFWAFHALAAATAVFHVSAIVALNTGCSRSRGEDDGPREWGWGWGCAIDGPAFALAFSVISFVFDFVALLLPQALIVRLPCLSA